MTDPMWTVAILAVLWLIVVVPMVLRRRDERAGERSVARFGASMRALSRRAAVEADESEQPLDDHYERSSVAAAPRDGAVSRRPVPASEESLMYPPDQRDMSTARLKMMARRRRSLTILGAGSVLSVVIALITGTMLAWAPAALFLVGLGGYLVFLRSQARRDRERRQLRRERQTARPVRDYDATSVSRRADRMDSVVRIDEDDVSLDHLDTIDLTGLYSEVEFEDHSIRRAG
jgi:membrane protein implicated in regulation of membrane protease activity